MNSVQQQCEHHHWKVLIKSFHLSGHTFGKLIIKMDGNQILIHKFLESTSQNNSTSLVINVHIMDYAMQLF